MVMILLLLFVTFFSLVFSLSIFAHPLLDFIYDRKLFGLSIPLWAIVNLLYEEHK